MKNSDFKKITSALTKTFRAFELSFSSLTLDKLGVLYSDEEYKIDFDMYVDDLGIARILIQHENDNADDLIKTFTDSLIEKIDQQLDAARCNEAKFKALWDSNRIYSHEFSYVSSVVALEMIKEIIVSMFRSKAES
jgi:hypothetical protein